MKRVIHQLVHTLSYGDAISTEVLALERCFHELGYDSAVYAINEHPNLRGRSRPFASILDVDAADLILHYSIGSPLNDIYRGWSRGRKAMVYHNITPPHWFRSVNPRVARDIDQGLDELPKIAAISDLRISDSAFNASELQQMGFSSQVLELTVDPGRWSEPRNEGIYSLVKSDPSLHVLHVGRLAPNKCVEDILKTFYFLHQYGTKKSKLWLVGIDTDTELYSFSLRSLAAELGIEEAVNFVGCMSDGEVRSLYEAASVYLCMSEHEGFCLPLIEAMHFGLPVVAYASSAVPATLGSGGILVGEKRHAEIAELVLSLATDSSLRQRVVTAGHERVRQLSYDSFKRRVAEVFGAA